MNFYRSAVAVLFAIAVVAVVAGSVRASAAPVPSGAPAPADAPAALAGTAFTFQGQLKNNNLPVNATCDFRFALWNDPSSGAQLGTTQAMTATITDGLFAVSIDFGNGVYSQFNGDARWLATHVRCPAGSGVFATLAPRTALTPAPIAFALPGLYTQQNSASPNVIGGFSGNTVDGAVVGAAIGGGGLLGSINHVSSDYATIGGGLLNTAGGVYATVGGGYNNTASGPSSSVPGGVSNLASGTYSFAAGNQAIAQHQGTFVWADSTNATFASSNNNQFLIRATGGVGINTNSPGDQLEVYGVDSTARIRNSNDTGGAFVGNTYNSLELGLYNPTGSTWGVIPANTKESFFGFDNNGYVCTLAKSFPGAISPFTCQNVLDNGGGDALVRGGFKVGGLAELIGKTYLGVLDSAGSTNLCLNSGNNIATCSSSRRYKSNIADLPLGLAAIMQLRPVMFDWKADGEHDLGLVAEEVNDVASILTTRNKDGQIEGVKYDRLTAVLVKGIQEQQQQIADLEKQNDSLQQQAADLKKQNESLQQQTAALDARLTALEQTVKAGDRPLPTGAEASPTTWILFGGLIVVGLVAVRKRG